jgi:hypothetical protein
MNRDITAGKHGGNAQSVAAYQKAMRGAAQARQDIVNLLKQHPQGLTCKEMSVMLNKEMHKLSGRITELKELGQVTSTDAVRDGGAVVVLISETPVGLAAEELAEYLLSHTEDEDGLEIDEPEGEEDARGPALIRAGKAMKHFDYVRDLLVDLMHYCDANDVEFEQELKQARRHYAHRRGLMLPRL